MRLRHISSTRSVATFFNDDSEVRKIILSLTEMMQVMPNCSDNFEGWKMKVGHNGRHHYDNRIYQVHIEFI